MSHAVSNLVGALGRATRKRYYEDDLLASCTAKVIRVHADGLELDQTVAFAEGGGQEGDCGVLATPNGLAIRFSGARKRYGRRLELEDFPAIAVDTIILHPIVPDDAHLIAGLREGDAVRVCIDIERRARLSLGHSAAHLVLLAAEQVRAGQSEGLRGCHIKEDSARFDFATGRFRPPELERIAALAQALVERDLPIRIRSHPREPEARSWECAGASMPCGGTHLARTGPIGPLRLPRRSLGKGIERLMIDCSESRLELERYHD